MSEPRRHPIGLGTVVGTVVAVLALVLAGLAVVPPSRAAATAALAPEGTDKISPGLQATLRSTDEAPFWVRFADRADLSAASKVTDWAERGRAVYEALTSTAKASQAKALAMLAAADVDHTPFWVSNAIYVRNGSSALAAALAADAEVSALLPSVTYQVPEPTRSEEQAQVNAVEWGVAAINADDVWSQFGATGNGIVVANIDTGVQHTHPALAASYRGNLGSGFDHNYNWFDPSRVCATAEPCDNHSHGTHVMGTMVGDDGAGNQIGVAPGARWIAAKGCETGNCSDAALLASGQWMVAPTDLGGQNPRPDLRPHVVNNSWGEHNGSAENPWYDDVLTAWIGAGIFPAFSNGNAGPGCDTSGSPGDSQHAYAVGAFDVNGNIASFSSRGAGADGKPDIAAPGVAVRSSVPGGYARFNGTSMASPHLAATVALIWSAAPELAGDVARTRAVLDQTAVDVDAAQCGGNAADNNVFGQGRLDALAAVSGVPRGPTGTLRGTLTNAGNNAPIADGLIIAVSGPNRRSARTGDDGSYTMEVPPGDYQITAAKFGYRDGTAAGSVTAGQTTTVDLALAALPSRTVRGKVVDQVSDKPVAGVQITLTGTPVTATTDGRGQFRLDGVPVGDYVLAATPAAADNCLLGTEREIHVDRRDLNVQLELGHVTDPYGYSCHYEPTGYVEADTVLPFDGKSWASAPLPFTFDLYNRSYRQGNVWVGTRGQVWFYESGDPNGAGGEVNGVSPFYDGYLKLLENTRIATRTAGRAPNRTFTIEWRDIGRHFDPTFSIDFEVTLHENGQIVFAYRDIDPSNALEAGATAWAWIDAPYASLNRMFLFASNNEATLSNDRQIRFTLPPNGLVTGTVTDANDRRPIAGARVAITDRDGSLVLRHLETDADGRYRARLFLGEYKVAVASHGYVERATRVRMRKDRQHTVVDAALATGVMHADPSSVRLTPGGRAELTLTNRGRGELTWRGAEIAGPPPANRPGEELGAWGTGDFHPGGVARTPDGNLWVAGLDFVPGLPLRIREYRPDGTPTGVVHDPAALWGLPSPGTFLYDLAYVPGAGLLCATGSWFDDAYNGTIYCFEPASGELRHRFPIGLGFHESTGIAYDQARGVFYVTGSSAEPIYTGGVTTVGGPGHARPGAILASCTVDFQPAGAAYNPTSGTLWAVGDTNPYTELQRLDYGIHQVDPQTCLRVSRFEHDRGWSTALDLDAAGNPLTGGGSLGHFRGIVNYASGDPVEADAPWLSLSRAAGTLAPGRSTTIRLSATGAAAGEATARILGNAGRRWDVRVPITVTAMGANRPA